MNLKLRLKNKTVLIAVIAAAVALIYTVLGFFGITPGISEDEIKNAFGILIELLVLLGVVVDPTTEGVGDSAEAMCYEEPKKRGESDAD